MASSETDDYPLVLPGSIEGTEEPTLIGSVCNECDNVTFPQREFCPSCLSDDVERTELSRRGSLATYTAVNTGQEGFETPYAFGFVELPEGVRLYSLLADWEPKDQLEVGMDVEVVFDEIKDDPVTGERLYGHKFRPVGGEDQ